MLLTPPSAHAQLVDCDMDDRGRLARLWVDEDGPVVDQDGVRVTLPAAGRAARCLRWIDGGLLLWPAAGGVGLLADGRMTTLLPYAPREVLVANRFLYACYGEEQFLTGTDDGDHAGDRITVHDRCGAHRLFGADDLLGTARNDPEFNEYTQGAVASDGTLVFVADASSRIWKLDPSCRTLHSVVPGRPIEVADSIRGVLLGDGQVGLVTWCAGVATTAWFDLEDGTLKHEDQAPALLLPSGEPAAIVRVRGSASGAFIAWVGGQVVAIGQT